MTARRGIWLYGAWMAALAVAFYLVEPPLRDLAVWPAIGGTSAPVDQAAA